MKNNRIAIIAFLVTGITLGLLFFLRNDKAHFEWWPTYAESSDQPYGIKFLRELLEGDRPDGGFRVNRTQPASALFSVPAPGTDYIFIGVHPYFDQQDIAALLRHVYAGNDAFIACQDLPEKLVSRIYDFACADQIALREASGTYVNFNFYHPALKTPYGYSYAYHVVDHDVSHPWTTFNDSLFCDSVSSIVPLGYQGENKVNFLKIPHGKGNLYLHTAPLAFTNYFVIKPVNRAYVEAVLSHLHGKSMILDAYSDTPFLENKTSQSPLYYMLQQPSLKYSWWLLLLGVLLYVLFASKRTQRVIPVLEPKSNTSLEFVKQIAVLHFQNGNHLDMVRKKMRYFQYFVRSKYGIPTQRITEDYVLRLSERAKVAAGDVRGIFTQYDTIERNSSYGIPAYRLVDFYNAVENFYERCS